MTTETTGELAPGTETAAPAAVTETATIAAAPASTAAATTEATTLLGGEVSDTPVAAPADWPTDWREKIAGDDKKELEQLKRAGSPADVWKKARALEQKLSSGEYKRDLPKDAKPEEIAAWREERGLPKEAIGYLDKLTLPEGVVLGEADKPIAAAFAEAAFEGNVDQGQYSKLVAQYYKLQDQVATQRAEADHAFKQKADDELRAEWGADYRPNITAVKNLLAGMPEGAADNLLAGRLADGTRIGDNPGMVKWLAELSRELNPVATLMPAGAGSNGVADRLGEIRKFRQENPDKYDLDKNLQAEELRLIEANQKMQRRAG